MPRSSYFRRPGDALTSAEAAHLLTRAAAGEVLPCLPVKTAKGWTLQSTAALDTTQLRAHRERLNAVAAVLQDAAPALPGLLA